MAMFIPSEYSKYVKNCKHLLNISRDTFLAIDEICRIPVLRKEVVEQTRSSVVKLNGIKEIHEKPTCIVVLGQSNVARAVFVNELFGGKRLLPTDKNHTSVGEHESLPPPQLTKDRDSIINTINNSHWKAVKIRHSTYNLLGTSAHSNSSLSVSPSTSSYVSSGELQVNCDVVKELNALMEWSMLDVDLKHIILRDGMQIWVAPSFHCTENRYNDNWCCTSPSDFFQLVEHCTSPIFVYAIHGTHLSAEEKKQLRLFKNILSPKTVIHFVAMCSVQPTHQVILPPKKPPSGSRQRRHTSVHPSVEEVVTSSGSSNFAHHALQDIPQSLRELGEQLKSLNLLSHFSNEGDGGKIEAHSVLSEMTSGIPSMLPFVRSLLQIRLVKASSTLHQCHEQLLRYFILSAFDWARQVQVTPLRLEYVRRKETELYNRLVVVANRKQEEIRQLIADTLKDSREELLNFAGNLQLTQPDSDSESLLITHFTEEIRKGTLSKLNELIAERLTRCVLDLREAYVGTLERCLESLEKSIQDFPVMESSSSTSLISLAEDSRASGALKRIVNAAYQIDLSVKTSSSFVQSLWERLQQFFKNMSTTKSLKEVNDLSTERTLHSSQWKKQIAANLVDTLNENRLARIICSQFRDRLRQSHESFLRSMRQLESLHTGRLEKNEELYYKVRKVHAPRIARLALEAISLRDMAIYGMPQLGRELGRGQYGVVYGCDAWGPDSLKGKKCAVKSVVPPDEKHWNDLAMEFHYSRMVPPHDRIVSLKGSVIDYSYGGGSSPAVLLVMERLNRDLHAALKAGLTWPKRLRVAIDVVEGIRFLHSQGLVHRDIKLKNVLLDSEDRAKITDLGFCKPEAMMSGSIVGTPIHMAPELFTGHYDSSVDVYAFGILFWYICSGHTRLPYAFEQCHNKDQLWQNVRRGVRPERLQCFDDACWNLMEDCWAGEAGQRPLLGTVQSRLEAIFMSQCHGRTIDTGSVVVQYEKEPDSVSSSPYVQVELEPTEPC